MIAELQISVGYVTETGRRPDNQDYLGICLGTPSQRAAYGMVAAVGDGVAGGKGGRIAAELAVRQFIDGYYAQPPTIGVQRAAARSIDAINRWLFAQSRTNPALENTASTFTALVLRGRAVHVLHVGDSRAYRLADDRLTRLTTDHTLNQHDLSHVLYRAVGIEEAVRLDHAVHPLRLYDRFLLCSDGVHGVLRDAEIRSLLLDRATPEAVARQVVAAALAAGSSDNVSALVIDVLALPPARRAELELVLAELPIATVPEPGDVVDGFRLGRLLSDGRYSRLFTAVDTVESRSVVLKFPRPEAAEVGAIRAAFLREAWVAARVRSPWLGEGIDLAPGRQTRLYAVTSFHEGETLERRLSREPALTLAEGVDLAIKLGRALAVLHRAGVIHRDVKPDNVMLVPGGGVKLIDLGVVRLPRLEEAPEESVPGTASYMAPEMFAGQSGDEVSDQYALGVTLYRAFCGAYPYGEIEPFTRPRFTKPVPLAARRRDLPAWLSAALARATAVNPNERFGDIIEFSLELENGLARGGPAVPLRVPLFLRDPLRFWQAVSLVLFIALVVSVAGR